MAMRQSTVLSAISTFMRGRADVGERWVLAAHPTRFLSLGGWLPEMRRIADANAVALTFDDGPSSATTAAILKLLREREARATFFLSGVRAAANPGLAQAIVGAGHDVFGHGWEHVHLDRLPAEAAVEAVDRCERLLALFRPTPTPYLIRLPYTAGHRSAALHRALSRWRPDTRFVHYSATFHDWFIAAGCARREEVRARVAHVLERTAPARLRGRIVLLHEMPFDGEQFGVTPTLSAEATLMLVEGLLDALRKEGIAMARLTPETRRSPTARYFLPPRLDMVRIRPR